MLHGIMNEQEYCIYVRYRVSERMNIFYMFPLYLLSVVPTP